jgi:hypothetical protein
VVGEVQAWKMTAQAYICSRCTRALVQKASSAASRPILSPPGLRQFSQSSASSSASRGANTTTAATEGASSNRLNAALSASPQTETVASGSDSNHEGKKGRLAQRLEDATEDALLTGGRSGRRAVLEEAGFSEELKAKLLGKLADAQFSSQYSDALAKANLTVPASAGQGTRDMASAASWTGEEPVADTVLRMLDDAHKPLKPELRGTMQIPVPVDLRPRAQPSSASPGQRAASARERATAYADATESARDKGLSASEREELRREFRERFTPGARAMPNSISGLAALANERLVCSLLESHCISFWLGNLEIWS